MIWAFHVGEVLLTGAAICAVARRPTGRRHLLAAAGLGGALLVLAVACSKNLFNMAGFFASSLFVYGPCAMLGSALVSWRAARGRAVLYAATAAILGGAGAYAWWVEPTWLEVTHIEVRSPKLKRPVTIAVVADLQADEMGPYERRALAEAARAQPDIVLFVGDYFQTPDAQSIRRLRREFQGACRAVGLRAKEGAFAVRGNIDGPDWAETFAALPVTPVGRARSIDLPGLRLTGLSLDDSRDPALRIDPAGAFHVVFGHYPDYALGDVQADLLIAGHTHGGQVRMPLVGPLLTASRVPRAWAAGTTRLPGGRTLIVSRGIGMERWENAPRIRLLCRPEIVIVHLRPQPAP